MGRDPIASQTAGSPALSRPGAAVPAVSNMTPYTARYTPNTIASVTAPIPGQATRSTPATMDRTPVSPSHPDENVNAPEISATPPTIIQMPMTHTSAPA